VKNANPEPSDHGHSTGIGNLPNVGFTPAAAFCLFLISHAMLLRMNDRFAPEAGVCDPAVLVVVCRRR
jgi:hypothetical protein